MPICIAGMHRSGTSMIARMLRLGGLYLGEDNELMPPLPENRDGFWEHLQFVDVNDRILESLGGWWDCPPPLPPGWETSAHEQFATAIQPLASRFSNHEP